MMIHQPLRLLDSLGAQQGKAKSPCHLRLLSRVRQNFHPHRYCHRAAKGIRACKIKLEVSLLVELAPETRSPWVYWIS